jgi:hypothetical protein
MLFPYDEYAELCGCKLISIPIAVRFFGVVWINLAYMEIRIKRL